jgi:dextranase
MYGGEKPVAVEHPEWLLYDGNGEPYHLIDLFYIQNFARGCGWREMILGEYEGAVTRLGFDGIHIDQYGFPKRAMYRPAPGVEQVVDLTAEMPDFVAEACERIRRIHPDGGNIFNCVNNWPVEGIAPLRDADRATYIEVWSPFDAYRDLHELVRHAKAAGPHKQVILSAYLKPFHRESERPEGAMSGLKLATAAIYAAGGFHLLLGEGDGVLADAYYPMFGRLSAADLAAVQRYYDFVVAYGELLHDMSLRDVTHTWMGGGFNAETRETNCDAPVGTSVHAEPGKVWTILHEKPGRRVLNLINLHGLTHDQWRQPQAEPVPVAGIQVQLQVHTPIQAVWCASPDDGGAPRRLAFEQVPDGRPYVRFVVPRLDTWTVVWTEE